MRVLPWAAGQGCTLLLGQGLAAYPGSPAPGKQLLLVHRQQGFACRCMHECDSHLYEAVHDECISAVPMKRHAQLAGCSARTALLPCNAGHTSWRFKL